MSRLAAAAAAFVLCLVLTACGDDNDAGGWTALTMAREIAQDSSMTELVPGDELYDEYVSDYYGLDATSVADGAILASGGASAGEVAVLYFTSADRAEAAVPSLEAYLASREADFTGYNPSGAQMIAEARVVTRGAWCALIVLPDSAAGAERFNACFSSKPPELSPQHVEASPHPTAVSEEPASDEWSYSEQRIISAYFGGDRSSLHEKDAAILDVVEYVLSHVATENMGDYERELAIHDYIIGCAQYDSAALSLLPIFEEDPDNTNPYGALIKGRAVCRGYSSTFQLFMDIIGIECITVEGFGNASRDEHAWNMVRLGGEWYCVDVTWDDPVSFGQVSDETAHRYFNVTSDFMRETYHFWDESSVPEAVGTAFAWTERKENT